MSYYNTILSLFGFSILSVLALLYIGNISREIEKENIFLKKNINIVNDQININEIEYSIFTSYEYLKKMQEVYFDNSQNYNLDQRVSFSNLKNKNLENFYTIGIK